MWHNFTLILLFAAAVAKSENSVASQIHNVKFVPDVKLITKSFDILEDPPTPPPTFSPTPPGYYFVGSVHQNFVFSKVRGDLASKVNIFLYISGTIVFRALRLNETEKIFVQSLEPVPTSTLVPSQNLTGTYNLNYWVATIGSLQLQDLENRAAFAASSGLYDKVIESFGYGFTVQSEGLPTFLISSAPTGAPVTSVSSSQDVLKSSYWSLTTLAIIPILGVCFACYAGYRCRKLPKKYLLDRSDDPDAADYMYPPI